MSRRNDAATLLRALLAEPMQPERVRAAAAGLDWIEVRRTAEALGVVVSGRFWRLPPAWQTAAEAIDELAPILRRWAEDSARSPLR